MKAWWQERNPLSKIATAAFRCPSELAPIPRSVFPRAGARSGSARVPGAERVVLRPSEPGALRVRSPLRRPKRNKAHRIILPHSKIYADRAAQILLCRRPETKTALRERRPRIACRGL